MSPEPTADAEGGRATRFFRFAVGVVSLGGAIIGYNVSAMSGAILYIKSEFGLGDEAVEALTGAALLGMVIGATLSGVLADRFGRRASLATAGVLGTVGATVGALAPNADWLLAMRVVVGTGAGVAFVASPLYLSEIAPARSRGRIVSVNAILIVVGTLLAFLVNYLLADREAWRSMLGLGVIPSLALLLGVLVLPESPRWLASRGRTESAMAALRRLRGAGTAERIELPTVEAGGQRAGLSAFSEPWLRRALTVGSLLAAARSLSGGVLLMLYAPTILEMVDAFSTGSDLLATVGLGALFVVCRFTAARFVDRIGRRPLILGSLLGMAVGMAALGLAFVLPEGEAAGWLAVTSLVAMAVFASVGAGTAVPLVLAEIYPQNVRGTAMSIANFVLWGTNFLVTVTFLTLSDTLGDDGTFFLYAAINVLAWLFVRLAVPETKGRPLEEVETFWQGRAAPGES